MLAQGIEARANDATVLCAIKGAKAARYLLFHLAHTHGGFSGVVGKRDLAVADKAVRRRHAGGSRQVAPV